MLNLQEMAVLKAALQATTSTHTKTAIIEAASVSFGDTRYFDVNVARSVFDTLLKEGMIAGSHWTGFGLSRLGLAELKNAAEITRSLVQGIR